VRTLKNTGKFCLLWLTHMFINALITQNRFSYCCHLCVLFNSISSIYSNIIMTNIIQLPPQVDKSGCFPTQRAVIVLLYFCQCFIGYLPCGGKLGCSAGNNRVVSQQHKFLPMFYRLSPLWGKIGLFDGEQ
jgi:hypothetical protein